MQKAAPKKVLRKPQQQQMPGDEFKMRPAPVFDNEANKGSGKLYNKIALITGGDSGIDGVIANSGEIING